MGLTLNGQKGIVQCMLCDASYTDVAESRNHYHLRSNFSGLEPRKLIQHGVHFHDTVSDLDECATVVADPRIVGDLCYSGYHGRFYLVVAMPDERTWTVLWLGRLHHGNLTWEPNTDHTGTHNTPWNWAKDRFVDFNMIESVDGDLSYADYDEFLAMIRDAAEFFVHD